jgi:PAS domain-containing protein
MIPMYVELELLLMRTALCVVTLALSSLIAVLLRRQARMLEEKRHSDSRYRIVVDQAGDGVFLVDAQTGRLTEANSSLRRRLGYGADEIVALKVEDILVEMPAALATDSLSCCSISITSKSSMILSGTTSATNSWWRSQGNSRSSLERAASWHDSVATNS